MTMRYGARAVTCPRVRCGAERTAACVSTRLLKRANSPIISRFLFTRDANAEMFKFGYKERGEISGAVRSRTQNSPKVRCNLLEIFARGEFIFFTVRAIDIAEKTSYTDGAFAVK